MSLSKRSAFSRFLASFAPTTSWWWKVTTPPGSRRRVAGLPMSCSRAARRRTRSGASPGWRSRLVVDRLRQHREAVLVDVLVVVVLVALEPSSRAARAARGRRCPISTSSRTPGTGSSVLQQLRELVAHALDRDDRRAVGARSGHRGDARRRTTVKPSCDGEAGGAHHAQRVVAERVDRGAAGSRGAAASRSLDAAGRVDEHRARAGAAPSR